jgi:tetratricopeptide (TPR) repeat protein
MKARRQQEAITWCRDALELDPNSAFSRLILARVLDAQGDLHEALMESERAAELAGGGMPYAAHLGYVHARLGNRAHAFGVLERLRDLGARRHICAYDIGLIHMALEEKELAFEWFERAFRERAVRLCELGDPAFDRFRNEPRFQDLARRIGLPLHGNEERCI